MSPSPTPFLTAGRKLEADGSIQLDAISRSLWPALAMLAGAICGVGMVVSQSPAWLAGLAFTPVALLGVRRRSLHFVAGSGLLRISDSGGLRAAERFLKFEDLRELRVVPGPSAHGPSLLVVNDEGLAWVGATYDNRSLESELRALVSAPGTPAAPPA